MMDGSDKTKQQISELADGELDAALAARLVKRLRGDELRDTWDLYHEIGDVIRADAMAASVSSDFSRRFAARLASEPVLLSPKPKLLSRIGNWPTTLAALAAAGFGFFVAPSLFTGSDAELPAVDPSQMARVSHGSMLVGAVLPTGKAEAAEYLLMHQAAHPRLYGVAPLTRPAPLDIRTDQ